MKNENNNQQEQNLNHSKEFSKKNLPTWMIILVIVNIITIVSLIIFICLFLNNFKSGSAELSVPKKEVEKIDNKQDDKKVEEKIESEKDSNEIKNADSDWATYQNSVYDFEFQYPKNWNMKNMEDFGLDEINQENMFMLWLESPYVAPNSPITKVIQVGIMDLAEGKTMPNMLCDTMFFGKQNCDCQDFLVGDINFCELKATDLYYYKHIYSVLKDNKIYFLDLDIFKFGDRGDGSLDRGIYQYELDTLYKIVTSFKFIEK